MREKNEGEKVYEVVDGQQRLTTLNIIFAVLKHIIKNNTSIEDIQKRLMPINPYTDEAEKPRLMIREQDREFFNTYILCGEELPNETQELTETQRLFIDNFKAIKEYLDGKEEVELRLLTQYILEKVYVVLVITNSLTSAFRLFNVLNARGMSLSNGDLVKNKLFECASYKPSEKKVIENAWNKLEELIGIKDLDIFLGHLRTAIKGKKAQETLYQEIDTVIDKDYKNSPAKFGQVVVSFAHNYVKIQDNDFGEKGVSKYLNSLKAVLHDEWIPPILAFLNKPVQGLDFTEYVKLLDKITYQNWVRRLGKTKRNTVYYRLINSINAGKSSKEIKDIFIEFADNQEFEDLIRGDFYNTPYRKAVLCRLENELQGEKNYKEFNGRIAIERILPERLTDKYWSDRFTKEEQRDLVNKLGNITLLSASKSASHREVDFDKKKARYLELDKKASFDLTKLICNVEEWTPNEIRERQETLVTKVIEIWRIE